MKTYLVGGAVRDELLELPVKDKDWVVVGATPDELIAQNYQLVGKDFPVFLHPESKEEYALARTERKIGVGYNGFECNFSKEVTLEEDLMRRDLTINAIAKDVKTGQYIDPYNGQQAIQQRVLKHISPAFAEDPLRVLRVARFAAKLAPLGFKVHPETNHLMYQLARSGELSNLTPERIWTELLKALSTPAPHVFLQSLRQSGCLQKLFPELNQHYGVPATIQWHPEIDTGVHLEMVMQAVATLTEELEIRFAALTHDLGKTLTYRQKWPKHHGHDARGVPLVENFCERFKAPKKFTALAKLVAAYHGQCHRITDTPTAKATVNLLNRVDAFKQYNRFKQFLTACKADHLGRKFAKSSPYQQEHYLLAAYEACKDVDIQAILKKGHKGDAIQNEITKTRIEKLQTFCLKYSSNL